MKRWSGSLFPILLLGALAALTLWLDQAAQVPLRHDDGRNRHDPSSIVENFTLRRLSPQGDLQYQLTSPKAIFYPDDESTDVTAPRLTYLKPGQPNLTIRSDQARITDSGDKVIFEHNVVAQRPPQGTYGAFQARMGTLTVLTDRGLATAPGPVEITEGRSILRGTGMELDHPSRKYRLLSRVSGTLYPNTTKTP